MKYIILALILVSCGTEKKTEEAPASPAGSWSLNDMSDVEYSCFSNMINNGKRTYTNDEAKAYCVCMVESVAKTYSLDDYSRNQTTINKALQDNGTAAACGKSSGIN